MSRQLDLAKRENFFSDPFFKDIMSFEDDSFQKSLEAFKNKSALALKGSGADTAHNLQVSCSNDKFMIQLELPGFLPEDFSLKTKDDIILLEACHEGKACEGESTSRKFTKELKVPEGVCKDQLQSTYSSEGILTISAPRQLNVPKGAEVQEAMASASKAYTTDDGKTAVKQDSSSASQMIATSTKSDDGSFSSSSTFSSSNMSSSSSTTTSSGPGGATMSLDMDDMMKKMMGGMSLGGAGNTMSLAGAGGDLSSMMKSGSSMMSSSSKSFSSSSSSMMSSSSSSTMTGMSKMMGGAGMPSLFEKMGPGVDFEELSTAGTEISGPPSYTVTSPRPSVDNSASGLKFTVQPTPDFKPKQQADCSVLLKLKQGDEYKLVLNMQQYNPENITVKLNGQELTILASGNTGNTDDFKQTHVVPEGIDLDQMSSSYSADGILVVKAPKKKWIILKQNYYPFFISICEKQNPYVHLLLKN